MAEKPQQIPLDELSDFCILLCDDNPANLQVLADLLKPLGFKLRFASDGASCIERALSQKPDLILLDVQMPLIDGFETCRVLKAHPESNAIPIIFLTAFTEVEHKVKGFELGGVDYILKPLNREELIARLRTHLKILKLQRQLALANAQLEEKVLLRTRELEEAYHQGIESLAKAVELRDHGTGGHSERVAELTVQLASRFDIQANALEDIRRGALLHDFGKIGIADSILLKKGPLDPEEREEMKRHPEIAYQILKNLSYLGASLDIPRYHHEKWDGSGYPAGLKAKEIPFSARLFSVIDVWDALSTDRPYRKALSRKECLKIIQALKGSHFDPEICQEFLNMLEE